MLQIDLLAVGTKPPAWVKAGVADYVKRMSGHCRFNVIEIKAAGRLGNRSLAQCQQEEAAGIRSALASFASGTSAVLASGTKAKAVKNAKGAKAKVVKRTKTVKSAKTQAHTIALDMSGDHWSTETLAARLASWSHGTSHCQFVAGGPDGLDRSIVAEADDVFALSHLTFPHSLVRVLLAEQIYRALMINAGHPYHK